MRILQIAPAVGWRLIEANPNADCGMQGSLPAMISQFLIVRPIACFALVLDEDSPGQANVLPVCADDWPSYLWPIDGKESNWIIDQLGPGEEINEGHVHEARRMVLREREMKASS